MNGLNWENISVAFASSFLGAIVRMAGMKMDANGKIITENGDVLTLKRFFKKVVFGVGCGVASVGIIAELIGKQDFNWLLIIGFLVGYGGEHFLPLVIKGSISYVKDRLKSFLDSDKK